MEVSIEFTRIGRQVLSHLRWKEILSLALGTSVKIKSYQDLVDWFCPLLSLPGGWKGTKIFGKLDNQFPKSPDDQLRKENPVVFLRFAPKRNYNFNFHPLLLLVALSGA